MVKKLTSVMGNSQMLDGGAMFGNVPKSLWSQWVLPNEDNQILLSCRSLLIQDNGKNLLLETGVGSFFSPVEKKRYGIRENNHVLIDNLHAIGIEAKDIDYIVLSHLHFDHAGGLLTSWEEEKKPVLAFENARFIVGKAALERALNPHQRDKASFITDLNQLLVESNRLIVVEKDFCEELGFDYYFFVSDGHTPGMLHTVVSLPHGPVVFAADLIPGIPWLHLPITMGYDRFPEMLINEKKKMLEFVIKENARLFYTHDPMIAMSRVMQNNKGRFICYDEEENIFEMVS